MSQNSRALLRTDRRILLLIACLACAYFVIQVMATYTSVQRDANDRFRGQASGFGITFFSKLHTALANGEGIWTAVDFEKKSVITSVFRNLCIQANTPPDRWQHLELVVTVGPHAGHYSCHSSSPLPITPEDEKLTTLAAAHRTTTLALPQNRQATDANTNAKTNASIRWLQSIGTFEEDGGYTPMGYKLLDLRLDSLLQSTMQSYSAPAEWALVLGDQPTAPSERQDLREPANPALRSSGWSPSGGNTARYPLSYWNSSYFSTADGKGYGVTLIQRSAIKHWMQWELGNLPGSLVVSTWAIVSIALVFGTHRLLKARRRLQHSVRVRGIRLQRRARALQAAQLEQHFLQAALLETTERERLRLGHELHDGAGQSLTGAKMLADSLAQSLNPTPPALTALIQSLQVAVEEVRGSARNLTPAALLTDGFKGALQTLALTYQESGVEISVTTQSPEPEPDAEQSLNLYRIAQEAVTNALRHGQATQIDIVYGGAQWLSIKDNGKGFDTETTQAGVGMRSQKLRAALLQRTILWASAPLQGTRITVT
jgi:signal transduction histidine kinase